MQYTAGIIKGC